MGSRAHAGNVPSARKPREISRDPDFYQRVWALVRKVPKGYVVTYGQIATWLGSPRAARAVGYAMFNAPDDVPWQRVVNAQGRVSVGGHAFRPEIQVERLKLEGVNFDVKGTLSLKKHAVSPAWIAKHVLSQSL